MLFSQFVEDVTRGLREFEREFEQLLLAVLLQVDYTTTERQVSLRVLF